jgi:hypothetical protein
MVKRRLAWLVGLLSLMTLALAGCRGEQPSAKTPSPGALLPTPPVPGHVLGNGSCAASGCHGSLTPSAGRAIQGNEYSTWLKLDPHADAYAVLSSSLGRQIGERLKIADVAKAPECLACHVNPQTVSDKVPEKQHQLWADGVSCEACHGPASSWLAAHSTEAWKRTTWEEKQKAGMSPILNWPSAGQQPPLSDRVKVCAGCHVGAPAENGLPLRDMNHDMIAAGHPRLNFEYCAYLANMPPHWKSVTPPDARSWAIGRLTSAEAALALLASRANPAQANKDRLLSAAEPKLTAPWPEFAEFDCFACHHDLASPSPRQDRGYGNPKRKAGSFLPNRWYLSGLDEAFAAFALPKLAETGQQKAELLASLARPAPPAAEVAQKAAALGKTIGEMRSALEAGPPEADVTKARDHLLRPLKERSLPRDQLTWDDVAQIYLARVAALGGGQDGDSEELYKALQFAPNLNSPHDRFPPWPTLQARTRP